MSEGPPEDSHVFGLEQAPVWVVLFRRRCREEAQLHLEPRDYVGLAGDEEQDSSAIFRRALVVPLTPRFRRTVHPRQGFSAAKPPPGLTPVHAVPPSQELARSASSLEL